MWGTLSVAALLSKWHICVTFNSVSLKTDVGVFRWIAETKVFESKESFPTFFCFVSKDDG